MSIISSHNEMGGGVYWLDWTRAACVKVLTPNSTLTRELAPHKSAACFHFRGAGLYSSGSAA